MADLAIESIIFDQVNSGQIPGGALSPGELWFDGNTFTYQKTSTSGDVVALANKEYVDNNFIPTSGDVVITGNLTLTNVGTINGVDIVALSGEVDNKQPLNSNLTALSGYNVNGFLTQTVAGTFTGRSLSAGSGTIIINANGVGGNPVISVDSDFITSNVQSQLNTTNSNLVSSGNILWNRDVELTNNLNQSGNILTASISNVQSQLNTDITNLVSSGNVLWNRDVELTNNLNQSGNILTASISNVQSQLNTDIANLISSGNILWNRDVTLTNNLNQSGNILTASISNVQSNLNTTNSNLVSSGNVLWNRDIELLNKVGTLSGAVSSHISATTVHGISGSVVGTTDAQTLINKNIVGSSNTVDASALRSAGASVNVASASAPTSGQILTATSATTAVWQKLNTGTAGTTFNIEHTSSTHTFNIPDASTTASGLVTVGNQTFKGFKTFEDDSLRVQNPAATFEYVLSGSAITAKRDLILPLTTQTEIIAVIPAILQSNPADPTGTTSATGVMMGITGSFTPVVTGRVFIMITGTLRNNSGDNGANVQLRTGTGTAPTNGAALTGTTRGGLIKGRIVASGGTSTPLIVPFACNAIVTGLTVGTAIWIDIGVAAITGGTASVTDLSLSVYEL